MASFSDYSENKVLNYLLRGEAFTVPNLYLALFTSSAGLETNTPLTQTEVGTSGTGYARVAVPSYTGFSAATSGQASNTVTFEFPTAQADWGNITHGAYMDAETGGNVIWWSSLSAPRVVYSGDTIRFAPNTSVITLD